jgi:hypothetical protein
MQDPLMAYRDQTTSPRKYHDAVETICPVCYDEFDDSTTIPRTMQYCSHLVCHKCIIHMAGPPSERPLARNRNVVRCPICKQKGRPLLSEVVHPGDRVALALVGAVKEIQCLGKRLKTETPGLTFTKMSSTLELANLVGRESERKPWKTESEQKLVPREDKLDDYRDKELVHDTVRCSEARIEEKIQWGWKREIKTKPRLEVIISLESGCVKVIRHM